MKENKGVMWLYIIITTVTTAAATVFNYILNKYYYETETGLYKAGINTPYAFVVFMIIGVFLLSFTVFIMDRDYLPKEIKSIPVLTSLTSVISAVVLVFSTVLFFMVKGNIVYTMSTDEVVYKMRYACSIVAIFAALYYLAVLSGGKANKKFFAGCSFFPMVWTWIFLMSVYFDRSYQMVSPKMIIKELALMALLLYQLMETRTLIEKPRPKIYLLVSGVALMFLTPAFLPDVIELVKKAGSLSLDDVYSIYGITMAAYVYTRMLGAAFNSGIVKKKKKHRKNDIFDEEPEEEMIEQY